jgi:hypothetical protein
MVHRATKPTFLADAVIGAHGQFANWTFDLISQFAAHDLGRRVLRIDRFNRIDFEGQPILLTNYPSSQLIDAIERGDVRVLFLAEPPPLTLRFMRTVMQIPYVDTLRSQTASAVANLAIGNSPHARVVERNDERHVDGFIRLICAQFDIDLPDETREQIAEQASGGLGPQAAIEQVLAASSTFGGLDAMQSLDRSEQVCQELVEPLLAMARGNPVRPIVWPTDVFTFSDAPETVPPSDPEIAGPARVLYYGPYLYLPPARYRVEVFLVFSNEIKTVPFIIEVHAGSWLAKARIEERQPGRFRGFFELDHYDATSTVEIRLLNETPVDSGRLTLVELAFFVERDRDGSIA